MNISDWSLWLAVGGACLAAAIVGVLVNVLRGLIHRTKYDFSEQDEEFTFEDDFPGG